MLDRHGANAVAMLAVEATPTSEMVTDLETLAAVSLAALDGMDGLCPGVCMNLYLTNAGVEVSAPPHTDEQDVVIVQTQGRKRWRVYSPPNNSKKPGNDPLELI